MALIVTVEKAQVSYVQPGLWNINMHLTATDDGVTAIDKDYSARFRNKDRFDSKAKDLISAMQIDIDKYYSERFIFSDKDIDILATTVQEGLDLREPTDLMEVRGKSHQARAIIPKKAASKKSAAKKSVSKKSRK